MQGPDFVQGLDGVVEKRTPVGFGSCHVLFPRQNRAKVLFAFVRFTLNGIEVGTSDAG